MNLLPYLTISLLRLRFRSLAGEQASLLLVLLVHTVGLLDPLSKQG